MRYLTQKESKRMILFFHERVNEEKEAKGLKKT